MTSPGIPRSAQEPRQHEPSPPPVIALTRLRWQMIIAVAVLALLTRVAFILLVSDGRLFTRFAPWALDADDYDRLARGLVAGEGLAIRGRPTAWRPPLYPLFLAEIYLVTNHSLQAVRWAQALLTACMCGLMAGWTQRWKGFLAGWIAGLGGAFYPWLVFWSAEVLTESLFSVISYGAVAVWWVWRRANPLGQDRLSWTIILGLTSAAAILTRPVFLPTVAVLWLLTTADWLFHRRGTLMTLIPWIVLPLVFLATFLAPWTIRNAVHFGRPILVSTNGGYNFYLGTFSREQMIEEFGLDVGEALEAGIELPLSEAEYDLQMRRSVWTYALSHPGAYLANVAHQWARFWVIPGFEASSSLQEQLLKFLIFAPVFLLGMVGLGQLLYRPEDRWDGLWFLAVLLSASLPYAISFGGYRFRIPLVDPLLIMLGAVALSRLLRGVEPASVESEERDESQTVTSVRKGKFL